MSKPLKLKAESPADLAIISAALQDAIGRVGDMRYNRTSRSLTLRFSRFQHETADNARVETGLRIDGVINLRSRGLNRADPDAMAVLLDIDYAEDSAPPGGVLTLVFAGGGEMRAVVEALDLILADVSEPRHTDKIPLHPVEDD